MVPVREQIRVKVSITQIYLRTNDLNFFVCSNLLKKKTEKSSGQKKTDTVFLSWGEAFWIPN